MVRHGLDIGDIQQPLFTGTLAADPALKIDRQTAVAALVRTDFEGLAVDIAVETNPVEMVELLVQLAGDRRHQRNRVGFTIAERVEPLEQLIVGVLLAGVDVVVVLVILHGQ